MVRIQDYIYACTKCAGISRYKISKNFSTSNAISKISFPEVSQFDVGLAGSCYFRAHPGAIHNSRDFRASVTSIYQ